MHSSFGNARCSSIAPLPTLHHSKDTRPWGVFFVRGYFVAILSKSRDSSVIVRLYHGRGAILWTSGEAWVTSRLKGENVMNRMSLAVGLVLSCLIFVGSGRAYAQEMPSGEMNATQLVTGLEGGSGSAIGPDGALYVTETAAGRISRVDPETGEVTTFADGLPKEMVGIGGAMDVAFIGDTAYTLVTLVGEDVGGSDVVGIYRVDGPDSFTVVADIGEFSSQNVPTNTPIDVPSGVQYAMEPYGDGFLVTDGHHNRLLEVTVDGEVTELMAWGNTVPTGLAMSGETVYMAEAGPLPHLPAHGKVVSFGLESPTVSDVASGARLVVDVEFGPDGRLYALSQGDWAGAEAGTPAEPNTGTLVEVNEDGTFTVIADGLDIPTSLEFIGNRAYVVTFTGDVLEINVQETTAEATCGNLPSHAELTDVLQTVVAEDNAGFGLHMWATVVNRDGEVCAVTFSGADRGDQFPGSRVISAQKANTANAFSLPGLALSTANLFTAVQPGNSLYGLQFSNPVDTSVAYGGAAAAFGQEDDPMVGHRIGGVNVFGGGLALYDADGALLGSVGVSGDSSCTDHIIAWKVRDALGLDYVPGGVSETGDDNIVYNSESGWAHAECGLGEVPISEALPDSHPLSVVGS